ncbi:MAG: FAD-binding oxidoreductase [Pseudomonadota bacterium]
MWIDALKQVVGPKGWVTDAAELEPHLTDWRDRYRGATPIMVQPESTEAVAAIVRICQEAGVAIVPQGGNTGLVGGATPTGDEVLLSLSRMHQIREVNAADYSITVEAGCRLADVQAAAADIDRLFPLSLSSEGSCQIGGNLSSNAGGINVLRYGTARAQVLGIEAVLADGTIWNGLRTLRKDTAGYDLKQLFIGSEGTLGIITAAALRLYPRPRQQTTALIAADSVDAACKLLSDTRGQLGDRIAAFELIGEAAMGMVIQHIPDTRRVFDATSPWYALIEAEVAVDEVEGWLGSALERGVIVDAAVAKNSAERDGFWRIRHSISAAQKFEGVSVKHDIAVPIGTVDAFLADAARLQHEMLPDARPVIFGHLGDGNLHHNVSQPIAADADAFVEQGKHYTQALYDLVARYNGSFSAEHGVGMFKKAQLAHYRSAAELALMKTLKTALDPNNRLNPGKIF